MVALPSLSLSVPSRDPRDRSYEKGRQPEMKGKITWLVRVERGPWWVLKEEFGPLEADLRAAVHSALPITQPRAENLATA